MSDQMPTTLSPDPTATGPQGSGRGSGVGWFLAMVIALLAAIATLLIVLVVRSDSGDGVQTVAPTLPSSTVVSSTTGGSTTTVDSTSSLTTTSEPTSSTSTSSVTTTTAGPTSTTVAPAVARSAIWPWPDSSTRFDDPVVAARSFAVDWVGFSDPIVGPFLEGDGRSGEVEVRPDLDGPVTVVLVRQLDADDSWWVIGAATAAIELDRPDPLDVVTDPLEVSGRSVAFEAAVDLELRVDGAVEPLVAGVVLGGATELAPFDASFSFDPPDRPGGAVLLFTISAENGEVREAAVTRVAFASS